MIGWLAARWVTGALFMAGATLALAPLIALGFGAPVALIYLATPLYMLHQVEEHAGDRFRAFVNRRVFGGREALSVADVLVINLPGVWGLNLLALYAAWAFGPGAGLAAIYLMLVNALAHVAGALRFGDYNPGLWTALGLFLPLGLVALGVIPASASEHVFGLVVAVGVHAAIIARAVTNAQNARG